MKKQFLLIAVLLLACNAAFAQYEDEYYYNQRPYQSYERSSYGYDYDNWGTVYFEYSPMKLVLSEDHGNGNEKLSFNGFTIGFNYAFRLGYSPAFIETGFETTGTYFSETYNEVYQKDDYHNHYGSSEKVKHSYDIYFSKIPVNIGLRFDVSDAFAIVPYAGLHLTINIAAEERFKNNYGDSEKYSLFDEDYMGDDAYKRFQVGYQGGLKFILFNTVSIGASYKGDLTPLYSEFGVKEKFRGLSFHIGY